MSNQVINQEAGTLQPSSLVTLYVLDATSIVPEGVDGLFRFHDQTTFKGTNVVWQGNTYAAIPCESEGWEIKSQGPNSRPKIRFENVRGLFTDLVLTYQDLVGAKLIRKRTFYSRLDSVNYPGYDPITNPDANPNADPEAIIPEDIYKIRRKTNENKFVVEFELSSIMDLDNVGLPGRNTSANVCGWGYRDGNCGNAEDFCFATSEDVLIPSTLSAIYYQGSYDPTYVYKQASVVWVEGSGVSLKDFYWANDTPVLGEDVTTSANWTLIQRFTGPYDSARVYSPGMTCYRVLSLLGGREYYYNRVACVNVMPPANGFWLIDRCSKLITGDKIRFSEDPRGLPFGGFPGLNAAPLGG